MNWLPFDSPASCWPIVPPRLNELPVLKVFPPPATLDQGMPRMPVPKAEPTISIAVSAVRSVAASTTVAVVKRRFCAILFVLSRSTLLSGSTAVVAAVAAVRCWGEGTVWFLPVVQAQRCRLAQFLGVKIRALLISRLGLLRLDRVGGSVRVMAHARYLPGDFYGGLVSFDREGVVLDFARNDSLGELAYHCQLVAKVCVEGFEIWGELYGGVAIGVCCDIVTQDIKHIRGGHTRLVEVLVGGVEWVVYLEGAEAARAATCDAQTAIEPSCITGSACAVHAISSHANTCYAGEAVTGAMYTIASRAVTLHPRGTAAIYANVTIAGDAEASAPAPQPGGTRT